MIKGLVFDKDGTLFDFSRSWEGWAVGFLSRISATEEGAIRLGEAIGFDYTHRTFQRDSVVIAGTPREIAQAMSALLPDRSVPNIIDIMNSETCNVPQIEAVPLDPLFRRFHAAGYTLGIVTNDAEAPARAHLSAAGISKYLDFVAGFDSGYGAKPDPGQLEAFLEASDLRADQCIMVGDSTHDLIAGRNAGMTCVGVLTGMAKEDVLDPLADVVLPDIGHLPRWLDGLHEAFAGDVV